jgi:hypothetical protein
VRTDRRLIDAGRRGSGEVLRLRVRGVFGRSRGRTRRDAGLPAPDPQPRNAPRASAETRRILLSVIFGARSILHPPSSLPPPWYDVSRDSDIRRDLLAGIITERCVPTR